MPEPILMHQTRANHFKGRIAKGGHLWLQGGPSPSLIFRSHGVFQRRYELRLPLADVESIAQWSITMRDGTTERFVVASGTGLEAALDAARAGIRNGSAAAATRSSITSPSAAQPTHSSGAARESEANSATAAPKKSHESSEPRARTPITTTPQLPGFKYLDVIGFSTALNAFAQAVPRSEWGYALKVDGAVISWEARTGIASDSQNNTYEPIRLPARTLPIPAKVVQIAGSRDDMLALTDGGDVWAWGEDYFEAIGQGSRDEEMPLKVSTLSGVVSLASAGSTHFAIGGNGAVWSWGSHYGGRLGDGAGSDRHDPAVIPLLTDVTELRFSARKDRVVALTKDGAVFTWGFGYSYEGDQEARSTPSRVDGLPQIVALGDGESAIDWDGGVWCWDENLAVTSIPGLSGIVDVVFAENNLGWEGTYHALDRQGRVYGWGYNNMGQIGDGTTVDRRSPVPVAGVNGISSIVTTGWTVHALAGDGTVFGWGGFPNERVPNIERAYGPSPARLSLPHFTEAPMQRWATLETVGLGTRELRETFFDFREGRTPLMQVAAAGFDDEVAEMLTQNGDVNAVDADGDTALFYAASKGHARIVELLLRAGANPNIHRITGGSSALAQAAGMSLSFSGVPLPPGKGTDDFWQVALLLIRGGADPSDMYSRDIAAARHSDRGMHVIRKEDLTKYMWHDDLFPIFVNPHSGLL